MGGLERGSTWPRVSGMLVNNSTAESKKFHSHASKKFNDWDIYEGGDLVLMIVPTITDLKVSTSG